MKKLVTIGLAFCVVGCGPPEPVHDGKSVSGWLDEVRQQELLQVHELSSVEAVGSGEPVEALVAMGDEAVPFLVEALEDESYFVRETAIEALGKIGVPAVDELVVAFGHSDPTVRQSAVTACVKVGSDAVPDLIEAMKSDRVEIRQGAVEVCDQLGSGASEAGSALGSALDDPDAGVRVAALTALPKVSPSVTREALDSLVGALNDPDEDVRVQAVRTLGGLGAEAQKAVPAIFQSLVDGDYRLQAAASQSLAQIGEPAVPVLIEGLEHEKGDVRLGSVRALADMESSSIDAVDGFIKALSDEDPQVRLVALRALGNLGSQAGRAVPAVVEMIAEDPEDDGQKALRGHAASTLGKISGGVPQAHEALIQIIREESDEVEFTAARALGSLKSDSEAIVPLLTSLLETPGSKGRVGAIVALLALGPKAQSALPLLEKLRSEGENETIRDLAGEAIVAIEREPRPFNPGPP